MSTEITAADLADIAFGAALLGGGGGGDPYYAQQMAGQTIAAYGPVTLLDAREVPDDHLTASVAFMGAPLVFLEKLPQGREPELALKLLAAHLGQPVQALTVGEVGGMNALVPIHAAARMRLPLVDADLIGRAVPELDMTIPALQGLPATPMTLVDERGNRVLLQTVDNRWTETLARALTVQTGGIAYIAFYPLRGSQVRRATATGTVSLAWRLGRAAGQARRTGQSVERAILKVAGGRRLFKGKVIQVERRLTIGFARGEALLDGFDDDGGHHLQLHFQNEYLVATLGRTLLAAVPDIIVVLDPRTGEPIGAEHLRYGLEVVVLTLPAPALWYTPAGLSRLSPRAFGYALRGNEGNWGNCGN